MSPTLVLKKGKPILSVGAPGGTRIITCVAQTLLNVLEFQLPLWDAIARPRFHHQWKPDVLSFDAPGPGSAAEKRLREMGYPLQVKPDAVHCRVMGVAATPDGFVGVSDPRDAGAAAGL
jgi:gamma-glutamyltranspeptidase/glutathione hydrolase